MAKLIKKKILKERVKSELCYANKNTLFEILALNNIKFKKSFSKDELVSLIEENKIDTMEIYDIVKKEICGMHPTELEKRLGINKTIRKKLEKANLIEVAYNIENRAYGKYISTPYYSIESLYKLDSIKLEKFINENYKKPSQAKKEGFEKAVVTRKIRKEIKQYEELLEFVEGFKERIDNFFSSSALILDTETTGLDYGDQIIEIAIIKSNGEVVLNSLVATSVEISNSAYEVHGISEEDLVGAPSLESLELEKILVGKVVYIYNSDFDVRLLEQSGYKGQIKTICLMHFVMEYMKRDRWISLSNAKCAFGIDSIQSHRAVDDCNDCLELMREIKKVNEKEIKELKEKIKVLKGKMEG